MEENKEKISKEEHAKKHETVKPWEWFVLVVAVVIMVAQIAVLIPKAKRRNEGYYVSQNYECSAQIDGENLVDSGVQL